MRYRLWVKDEAKTEIRQLPGHMRQRIRRAIESLSIEPRPQQNRKLSVLEHLDVEARRIRLDRWRVLYIVDERWLEVGVLAVRERPPYDYEDLPSLLNEFRTS